MTPLRVHFLHGLSDHFLDFIRQRIDHPVRITRNRGDGEPTAEPDLSTPVAAIPECIADGIHGLLVEDAPETLAAAIVAFAAREDGGQSLAEAALHRLKQDFSMVPGIERLAARLRALTGEAS